VPLLAYGLALISHGIARLMGGKGSGFGARLALFWALLAVAPAMLLQGLTAGFIGPSAALYLVQGVVLTGFLWMWVSMLVEVEQGLGL
jgi:hypothetical protein